MSDPHDSQARIGRADIPDDTVGCALLVTSRHVVTCAHVVAESLGVEAIVAEAPGGDIPVDLPLLARRFRTTAKVIRWLPVRQVEDKTPEDIAVLELTDEVPPGTMPAPLFGLAPDDYTELPVHCFGFPIGIDEGVRRTGVCRGENALGWVQLDVQRGLVEGGFSGTGAWDPERGAAVGLVVAARTSEQSAALIPARTLFVAWPELESTWRPRNPYKGLAAFAAADRADFFGRADLIPRFADRVLAERFTTLIGPSGSGKSSLLGAGLIPELADRGDWRCVVSRPGEDPFDELAARLMPREGLTLAQRTEERQRLGELLADPPEGPVRLLREYLVDAPETSLLLVVDQFEELFTNVQTLAPDKARDYVAALQAVSASALPVHLVIAMRADFMGRAMEGPAAAFVQPSHQFLVAPLAGDALRSAVEDPARALGVHFEPGLVEAILAELGDQAGRLPLLQFALTRLWDEQHARTIGAGDLERIGGVRRALSAYADGVIDALGEAERGRARRILVQLVRPPERENEVATRQVASFRRIPEQDQRLLPELARSRLIVTSRGPGDEPIAEIAHEALIREWGRLETWVAEDRTFRLWQEGLRSRMADWSAHNRHVGYLLSGPPLVEAEGWLATRPADLSEDDSGYIRASRRRAERHARMVRGTVAAVIVILAAFGALAWWQWQRAVEQERVAVSGQLALQSLGRVDEEPDLAILLAIEAGKAADTVDAQRSLLTALSATKHVSAFLAQSSYEVSALDINPGSGRLVAEVDRQVRVYDLTSRKQLGTPIDLGDDIASSISITLVSPDGTTIAVSTLGAVTLWDADTHELQDGFMDGALYKPLAYSPDGKLLAVATCAEETFPQCSKGRVLIWDMQTHALLGEPLIGHEHWITALRFVSSGVLVSGSFDGEIILWDVVTGKPKGPALAGHADLVNHFAVDDAGELLASASGDGTVRLWNLADRTPHGAPVRMHDGSVRSVEFLAGGRFLVSAGGDGKIIVWKPGASGRDIEIQADTTAVSALAYDGRAGLVSGTEDGDLVLWDLANRSSIADARYLRYKVSDVDTSPRWGWIAAGDAGGTVTVWSGPDIVFSHSADRPGRVVVSFPSERPILASSWCPENGADPATAGCEVAVWKLPDGDRIASFTVAGDGIESLAFAPDGERLAIGTHAGRVLLKNIASADDVIPPIAAHTENVEALAFSPDGRRLATASYDKTVKLWNAETGESEGPPLGEEKGTFLAIEFSPDGRLLAWGGGEREITLWDLEAMKPIAPPLREHSNSVFDLAFSPDGKTLASADFTGLILLWDVRTQKSIGRLVEHTEAVTALDFDTTSLWSGGHDGKVIEWNLDHASWIELGCRVANRNLSWSEWRQYIGGGDYRRTCASNPPHSSFYEWGLTLLAAGDFAEGEAVLRKALALDATLDLDPALAVRHARRKDLIDRGKYLAAEGRVAEAIELFSQAEALGSADEISADAWNKLCWTGSLAGFATEVLYACEHAVRLADEQERPFTLDSRAIARALAGDRQGAAEDLETFIAWAKEAGVDEELIRRRAPWPSALRAGRNPFDQEALDQLRRE